MYYLHSVVYDACQNQVRAGAEDAAEPGGMCKGLEGGILCRLEGGAGRPGEQRLPELVADLGECEEGAFFCCQQGGGMSAREVGQG